MIKPTAVKNLRGRITGYRIELAGITAEADTKDACRTEWDRLAELASRYAYQRRYDWAADGSMFTLYWSGAGWAYDIVHPGSRYASGCLMQPVTHAQATEAYERHLAQYNESLAAAA